MLSMSTGDLLLCVQDANRVAVDEGGDACSRCAIVVAKYTLVVDARQHKGFVKDDVACAVYALRFRVEANPSFVSAGEAKPKVNA
jgi:hypothetical protein